jgi:hypothetical protein
MVFSYVASQMCVHDICRSSRRGTQNLPPLQVLRSYVGRSRLLQLLLPTPMSLQSRLALDPISRQIRLWTATNWHSTRLVASPLLHLSSPPQHSFGCAKPAICACMADSLIHRENIERRVLHCICTCTLSLILITSIIIVPIEGPMQPA